MAINIRPASDKDTGSWTAYTTPGYSKIDEAVIDDNDYMSGVVGAITKAQDQFTDANGTALRLHSWDSGFSGWTIITGADPTVKIWNNTLWFTVISNLLAQANGDLAAASDNCEIWADITFPTTTTAGYAWLVFRGSGTATNPGYLIADVRHRGSGDDLKVRLARVYNVVTEAEVMPEGNVVITDGFLAGGIRLGVTLSGTSIQLWTEPKGGGTRTNRGAAWTPTNALTSNSRVGAQGKAGQNNVYAGAWVFDEIRVVEKIPTAYAEVGLGSTTDPGSGIQVTLKVRAKENSTPASGFNYARGKLMSAADALIATVNFTGITSSFQTFEHELSTAEVALIGAPEYAGGWYLILDHHLTDDDESGEIQVSWAELEILVPVSSDVDAYCEPSDLPYNRIEESGTDHTALSEGNAPR